MVQASQGIQELAGSIKTKGSHPHFLTTVSADGAPRRSRCHDVSDIEELLWPKLHVPFFVTMTSFTQFG